MPPPEFILRTRHFLCALALLALAPRAPAARTQAIGTLGGELKQWHTVTITFDGPRTAEAAELNPFKYYRLDVIFSKGGFKIRVPGYYAADGDAARTGAYDGGKWRVCFAPPSPGTWRYKAEFRAGPNIAAAPPSTPGTPLAFDGVSGRFTVTRAEREGRDLHARGPLRAGGLSYPQFANGQFFIKAGAGGPENFFAYAGFDQTPPTHYYAPHVKDWKAGDPTWRGGRGKGIIGALNYLADRGMNSVCVTAMNARGAGRDVWPWTAANERYRFDCSKLDQWEIVLTHMDRLGLAIHLVTQEAGNDHLLDGGYLGLERKLYYRELVARFGHHPGLIWDLGRDSSNTADQIKSFARYLKQLDPYDHPVVVNPQAGGVDTLYEPLLGFRDYDGGALQVAQPERVYEETLKWIRKSARARRPWFVSLDQAGGARVGAVPDSQDREHATLRQQALWGNLMAGGAGVEWTFGQAGPHNNLRCESWRTREHLWTLTRHAVEFFQNYLPLRELEAHDDLLGTAGPNHCLAVPGEVYAIYLPQGGTAQLNLGGLTADFTVKWYNPRTGEEPGDGTIATIHGPARARLGIAPADIAKEWVVLVKRMN